MSDQDFTLQIIGNWKDLDPADDNVDVYVTLPSGQRFSATFFTPRNVESLLDKNEATGECAKGLYLWASEMIVIRRLTEDSVLRAVGDLLDSGEFEAAFRALHE